MSVKNTFNFGLIVSYLIFLAWRPSFPFLPFRSPLEFLALILILYVIFYDFPNLFSDTKYRNISRENIHYTFLKEMRIARNPNKCFPIFPLNSEWWRRERFLNNASLRCRTVSLPDLNRRFSKKYIDTFRCARVLYNIYTPTKLKAKLIFYVNKILLHSSLGRILRIL